MKIKNYGLFFFGKYSNKINTEIEQNLKKIDLKNKLYKDFYNTKEKINYEHRNIRAKLNYNPKYNNFLDSLTKLKNLQYRCDTLILDMKNLQYSYEEQIEKIIEKYTYIANKDYKTANKYGQKYNLEDIKVDIDNIIRMTKKQDKNEHDNILAKLKIIDDQLNDLMKN